MFNLEEQGRGRSPDQWQMLHEDACWCGRGLRRRVDDGRGGELAKRTGGFVVAVPGALKLVDKGGKPRAQPHRHEQARATPQDGWCVPHGGN